MSLPLADWRPVASLWERWINLRNGLIATPEFQRWAAGSPLTRYVARRRTRALFDLCAGFVYSQILLACVKLDLFEILAKGPRSAAELSARFELSPDATTRLLRAAVSLKLLRALPHDRYALADLGAAMLGNPSIAGFVEHHGLLYDDLRDPLALLRGEASTRLSAFWPYAADRPETASDRPADIETYRAYSELMARSQAMLAQDLLDAFPLDGRKMLLDVGGGEGAFVAAAAERFPALRFQLFDLPGVAERARANFAARGVSARVEIHAGSFLRDALPTGADVVSLVRVLHDHDDDSARAILRAIRKALPAGGALLLAEPMAETPGAEPIGDAYFGFYLLAMGRGRPRSAARIAALLKEAGFTSVRPISTRRPLLASAIIAHAL
jgi:demethylspheroidene O-methyltransferase